MVFGNSVKTTNDAMRFCRKEQEVNGTSCSYKTAVISDGLVEAGTGSKHKGGFRALLGGNISDKLFLGKFKVAVIGLLGTAKIVCQNTIHSICVLFHGFLKTALGREGMDPKLLDHGLNAPVNHPEHIVIGQQDEALMERGIPPDVFRQIPPVISCL